jgi:hypothetical protein
LQEHSISIFSVKDQDGTFLREVDASIIEFQSVSKGAFLQINSRVSEFLIPLFLLRKFCCISLTWLSEPSCGTHFTSSIAILRGRDSAVVRVTGYSNSEYPVVRATGYSEFEYQRGKMLLLPTLCRAVLASLSSFHGEAAIDP